MREVAALAGVSLKTVSRAINREPGVSPDLLDRVEDAISPPRLPPQRDGQQSAARRPVPATVGLMLDDVSNPFSLAMTGALEDVARQRETLVFAGCWLAATPSARLSSCVPWPHARSTA